MKKKIKDKTIDWYGVEQWCPITYIRHLTLGGWMTEKTEQLFYLGEPTNHWRVTMIDDKEK